MASATIDLVRDWMMSPVIYFVLGVVSSTICFTSELTPASLMAVSAGTTLVVYWRKHRFPFLSALHSAEWLWYVATASVLLVMALHEKCGDRSRRPSEVQIAPPTPCSCQSENQPIPAPTPTVSQPAVNDGEDGRESAKSQTWLEAFLEEHGDPLDWPWY